MMHVTPQIGSYEAQLKAEHIARRQRLMGMSATKALPLSVPEMPPIKKTVYHREKPLWKESAITFSDHVYRWRFHLASLAAAPVMRFMSEWCNSRSVNLQDVLGGSRRKAITSPRHMLIWEVRQAFPELSLPAIGRIFGRDHTSILNAVQKIEAQIEKK